MSSILARLVITLALLVFMTVCVYLNRINDTLVVMIASAVLGYWFGYHDRGFEEWRNGKTK